MRFVKSLLLQRRFFSATSSSSSSSSSSNSSSTSASTATAAPPPTSSEKTHFGFRDVPKDEKQSLVNNVFGSVASSYDVMNDFMSLGIHRLWKDSFVARLNPPILASGGDFSVLDVAGGTGDIAFRILNYSPNSRTFVTLPSLFPASSTSAERSRAKVTVLDINPSMLEVGKAKSRTLIRNGSFNESQIQFILGNAEDLSSIPDNSYDAYTIAFGIRNCTHLDRVLSEAYRVLKPGGRFLCLEFSKISNNPILAALYDGYSFNVIPKLGQVVANDHQSYQYLVESIRKFPGQKEFGDLICKAGFSHLTYENMSQGIVAIHSGFKM